MNWLASYPKSGNTWLRFLVYVLATGRPPEHSREVDDFANSRPAPASGPLPDYKKTHCEMSALEPAWSRTRSGIYVCRHPLDTLCSTLNYDVLTGQIDPESAGREAEATWKRDRIDAYLTHAGAPEWIAGDRNYGSWIENVTSWAIEPTPFPVLTLRYEDMLADTRATVVRIAAFLGIEASETAIAAAIEATGFDALRRMEDAEIAAANAAGHAMGRFSGDERRKAAAHGVRFFNSGRSGRYRDILTPEQVARGQAVFGETAARLGYEF
jgi:aryl sulfotransferase